MRPRPVVLAILDGWGVAAPSRANAISRAKIPHVESFLREYPAVTLQASGEAVGLPWGEPGNSEVGHLALGSGRIVYQDFPLITKSIRDGSFFQNTVFLGAMNHVRDHKSALHLVGLVSSGGVHSYYEHLYALLELAERESISKVYVHAILDGRDTTYNSAADFIEKLQTKMTELGVGKIASLVGRFWAMDRDHHWDRISAAYRGMVRGEAERFAKDPVEAIKQCYAEAIFDEEIPPIVIGSAGHPTATIQNNDGVIFFNFRPDRVRELVSAFVSPVFTDFERGETLQDLYVATMPEYDPLHPTHIAFPKERVTAPLAKILSDAGLKQLHIAETEKYAHVTYFFNGGFEVPFSGEEHVLIPSRPLVSHADAPEMAAREITENVTAAILSEKYDFIVLNFANADMVGHTGNEEATVKAVECLDQCLSDIADAVLAKDGLLMITADHGNAEVLLNVQTGEIDKEHNASPVPLMVIGNAYHGRTIGGQDAIGGDLSLLTPAGVLADIAPTILTVMGLTIPNDMTGRSLI